MNASLERYINISQRFIVHFNDKIIAIIKFQKNFIYFFIAYH
jgi:hypothetical protein